MAVVYLGTVATPAGERRVALKQLRSQRSRVSEAQLIEEARLVFQLTHANICQVLDLAVSEAGTFLVMEYVDGVDLRTLLNRLAEGGRRLDVAIAVHIAREVAQALDYAHRRVGKDGTSLLLVHGDVTPANILLSREGEVKLADFGIARALGAAPGNSVRGGTVGFAAPELHQGRGHQRSDVYSLGATLYYALGGEFSDGDGIDLQALRQQRPEVTAELLAILRRATASRREDRYLSARELERELGLLLARRFPNFSPAQLAELVAANATPLTVSDEQNQMLTSMTQSSQVTPALERRSPQALFWMGGVTAAIAVSFYWVVRTGGQPTAAAPVPAVTAPPTPPTSPVTPSPQPPTPAVTAPLAATPANRSTTQTKVTAVPTVTASEAIPSQKQLAKSEAIAFLTVESQPWGAVYVDDRKVADFTPVRRVPVKAGKHRVTVFSPQRGHSPAREVVMRGGQTYDLGFKW
jgi:serine/threonine protein kinase